MGIWQPGRTVKTPPPQGPTAMDVSWGSGDHCTQAKIILVMVVLLVAEETMKEEAVSLAARAYLIVQLSEDLRGTQWATYDQGFREWAAAKGLRKWGLAIYGQCLSVVHLPPTRPATGSKRKAEVQVE